MSDTPSDSQVRAEDQARVGADAVESRAISVGNVVRNRRAQPDAEVPRTETRAIYADPDGRRRVVGAGQAIPDGWTRIESATVSDRQVATNLEDGELAGGEGAPAKSKSASRSK